jgi:two-component system sensor histidine kinase AlgZ
VHPILAQRRGPVVYHAVWVSLGLTAAILLNRLAGIPLITALALTVPLALIYGFICLAAWYLCLAAPLRQSSAWRIISVHGFGGIISSSLWVVLGHGWATTLDGYLPGAARFTGGDAARFVAGVLLFFLSGAASYLIIMLEESKEAETRALKAQVLARDAELRALRSQITPHFLFNALNSINALTSIDPAAARRMCLLLSDFFRGTLQMGAQERIPLAQELSLIDQFLAIEQVRFGERLHVEREIEEGATRWMIPPLLLQPLVENAVTHGIADLIEGGIVRLTAHTIEQHLAIVVDNPRDPTAKRKKSGAGMGLMNVQRRLDMAYGRDASLRVNAERERFRVELLLPGPPPPLPAPAPAAVEMPLSASGEATASAEAPAEAPVATVTRQSQSSEVQS